MDQRRAQKTQLNLAKIYCNGFSTQDARDKDSFAKKLQFNNNFAKNMECLKIA